MGGFETGRCAETQLPETAQAPEWIHLLPVGAVQGRDGRSWVLNDPQKVIAESMTGVDLPIDYEHQIDDLQARNGENGVKAAGWIKELQVREDGIWGRVEWTSAAKNLIEAREYRYLSPVFDYDPGNGRIVRLVNAGLVHQPNLRLRALSSENRAANAELGIIAQALGLKREAGLADVLQGISALSKPDPSQYVPVALMTELMRERNSTIAAASESDIKTKVDTAVSSGHLPPAFREWATALCRQDRKMFDQFVDSVAPTFSRLFTPTRFAELTPAERSMSGTDEADQVAAQLGISRESVR